MKKKTQFYQKAIALILFGEMTKKQKILLLTNFLYVLPALKGLGKGRKKKEDEIEVKAKKPEPRKKRNKDENPNNEFFQE